MLLLILTVFLNPVEVPNRFSPGQQLETKIKTHCDGSVELHPVKWTESDCVPDTNLKAEYYPRQITHLIEQN